MASDAGLTHQVWPNPADQRDVYGAGGVIVDCLNLAQMGARR
jgi:hypothetical protein